MIADAQTSAAPKLERRFESSCRELLATLDINIHDFRSRAQRQKIWHNCISVATVIGSVAGPTVIAYLMGSAERSGGDFNLLIVVIAALLGAFGAVQRVFGFGLKYVEAVKVQIDLEDVAFDLSNRLDAWDGREGIDSESARRLGAAYENAQKVLSKVRRRYLLAEMNIVEQQITSSEAEAERS